LISGRDSTIGGGDGESCAESDVERVLRSVERVSSAWTTDDRTLSCDKKEKEKTELDGVEYRMKRTWSLP
jgi:hypothetical protein